MTSLHAQEDTAQTSVKKHTKTDVAAHNKVKDCWIIIDGKVYDVTKFAREHPGGEELVISNAGSESSARV